ncbi:NAD(P)H-binding protein [Streptococcus sp. 121]|nr:NAD(P)H-binding protein [Streptococcus sp. 121]
MMKFAMIGASSRIGLEAIDLILSETDWDLNLFLRNQEKLSHVTLPSDRVHIFEGSADSVEDLVPALEGVEFVFASLAGDMEAHANALVTAMKEAGVARMSFVTTLGILDEVPGDFGAWNNQAIGAYLPPYQAAAEIIEASDLDYTIFRPAWLTNQAEVDYEVTLRDEPFKGTEISRRSVAAAALDLAKNPEKYSRQNIGLNKPGTNGPKPAFM